MAEKILSCYRDILHFIAEITAHTLELIAIFIIIAAAVRVIYIILPIKNRQNNANVMLNLGRSLALALEFEMGAEIINTVIVKSFEQLALLAIVIALRASLTFLIIREIKSSKHLEDNSEE